MKLFALALLVALPALSACGPKAVGNSTPAPAGNTASTPVSPTANSNASEKRKEIHLEFKDVPLYMLEEFLVKKIGKPLKTRKVKRSERCSDGPNKIFEYPGLTIELIYDSESGDYKVFSAEATSAKWPVDAGFTVGSDIEDVLAVSGEPPPTIGREAFQVVHHETESGTDSAIFYFNAGKLSKIKIGDKDCLDEN